MTLGSTGRARLAQWVAIGGRLDQDGRVSTRLVLDAAPALDGAAGRAAELADVALL